MIRGAHHIYFNSIKVRLERGVGQNIPDTLQFQFHKGTIRTFLSYPCCRHVPNFNSIKVRLELDFQKKAYVLTKFQFHKGTIRTKFNSTGKPTEFQFQFHKGTIRTTLNNKLLAACANFNSIKVRLEHERFNIRTKTKHISIP